MSILFCDLYVFACRPRAIAPAERLWSNPTTYAYDTRVQLRFQEQLCRMKRFVTSVFYARVRRQVQIIFGVKCFFSQFYNKAKLRMILKHKQKASACGRVLVHVCFQTWDSGFPRERTRKLRLPDAVRYVSGCYIASRDPDFQHSSLSSIHWLARF